MITLLQQSNYIIGSPSDIKALAKKDHARILVMSDSHNNYRILKQALEQYGPECDAFAFCGDGARDIAEILEQANEDEEFRKKLPPVMAFARGNGDPDIYSVCYDIGRENSEAEDYPKGTVLFTEDVFFTVNGQNIVLVHGHYDGVDYGRNNLGFKAQLNECSIALYGHTHVAREERFKKQIIINPGSCSRPRGGQPASFAIITVEKSFVDTAFIKAEDFSLWTPIA